MIDHIDYRLAFILPNSRQLLGQQVSETIDLPIVSTSMWRRPAEQLTTQIEEQWKIKSIVLDVIAGAGGDAPPCAVVEVRSPDWNFERDGFRTVDVSIITNNSLSEGQRSEIQLLLSGSSHNEKIFSRIGWIEEAQDWIRSSVTDHEVIFNGEIHHLNASGTFCLLRLGTQSGPAYWIKGVGAPNAHEFDVTNYLAKHCPQFLPPVIAVRKDWNAWIMEEFGSSLHHSKSLEDFKRAVHQLANLQKQLAGVPEALRAAGCADHRLTTLRSHIDEIVDYLDGAMRQQTSTKAKPVSSSRLDVVRTILHDACCSLEGLHIPDSLMHNDISPGSILGNGFECVFTDWCEAYVGNPFITFEQLCVHVHRKTDQPELWVRELRNIYKSCWMDMLTEHQIDRAFRLSSLVSVFSYLYGRGDWIQSARRNEPTFMSYSRSLARHMDRIADRPEVIEAICLPHHA
jgi:hypothetical protein